MAALLGAAALALGFALAPAAMAAPADAGAEPGSRTGEPISTTLLRAPIFESEMWTLALVDPSAPFIADAVPVGPSVLLPPATGTATLALQVDGPAPADLDLAGVRFELTGPGADPTTTPCVTDAVGSCTIRVVPGEPADDSEIDDVSIDAVPSEDAEVVLPAGTYAVRQVTAPAGLVPADAITPLELCVASTSEGCVTSRTVVNVSTYRTRTEIQVLSANGLVTGAEVTLTGPGYPATSTVTDEDGRGAWSGWFRPGEWWFAVAGQPAPLLMTMAPGRGDTSLPWRLEITLPSVEQLQVPVPGPAAGPSAAGPSAEGPPAAGPSSGGGQPAASPAAGNGRGAGSGAPVARVVPTDEPQVIAAPAPAPAPTAALPSPVESGNGQVLVDAGSPALETEGNTQVLSAGLGILFVALVLTGYGVLRSRQRRRA
ncbi:hypothetical protein SAMN05660485_01886 [Blastococcus fimeti]|nr:hypothetical protein SAMN05660485_01886 [Blastococcus fimeti]